MSPENAKDFGLIDKVVFKREWFTTYSFSLNPSLITESHLYMY
jgi:hypothetical protein